MPPRYRILGFTVDGVTFACHLGCNEFETESKVEMAKHLIGEHTEKELDLWHIPILLL